MDYRLNENRRKVFIDFYKFHLNNKAHAGAVYYAFPFVFDELKMDDEQKYWFVFINGCSQNVVTTYLIYKSFPDLHNLDFKALGEYFRANYERFGWDTDRRYVKNKFENCIKSYIKNLNGKSQKEFFESICSTEDKYKNFRRLWNVVISNFEYFGRLSTFSYLEYLRIAGLNLDCDNLFLEDISGSKSHRNGLCKVLGRDDLDWNNENEVTYNDSTIDWLNEEAKELLRDCKDSINHEDLSYFTMETTLCCYKGWHRVNRRYPNVYNDMFYERIRKAETIWSEEDLSIFWNARKKYLDKDLRLEDNILDKGLCVEKQNHYRLTGEVIMMESMGYEVKHKTWLRNCVLIIGCCGVGKTWVMTQLLKGKESKTYALGKFCFHETDDCIVVGKYDGSTFQGSDRLSMSVITDLSKMLRYIERKNKLAIFEGDRFMNSRFIETCNPAIIKIDGDGSAGRNLRGSKQTSRFLKSISTRVFNIKPHKVAENSEECLREVIELIDTFKKNNEKN